MLWFHRDQEIALSARFVGIAAEKPLQKFGARSNLHFSFGTSTKNCVKFKMCPARQPTIFNIYFPLALRAIEVRAWGAVWIFCAAVLFPSNQSLAQEIAAISDIAAPPVIDQTLPDAAAKPDHKSLALSDADHKLQLEEVRPFLESYCADCHLGGADEGGVVLDELLDQRLNSNSIKLWDRALGQLRSDLMPPIDMDQPSDDERRQLAQWVNRAVFQIDAKNPNPGRVVLGRLNRVEYRNTIADLLDYEINTDLLFPPDDTGHGFDNIGEVLTLSPLLMEKYINAATEVVMAKVPQVGSMPQVRWFEDKDYELSGKATLDQHENPRFEYHLGGGAKLNFEIEKAGEYRLELVLIAAENYTEGAVDDNVCHVKATCDEDVLLDEDFTREDWRYVHLELEQPWEKGTHAIQVDVTPVRVSAQKRQLRMQIDQTRIVGPLDDPESFVRPDRYTDYFEDIPLETFEAKRASAGRVLKRFASRAFRRPVSEAKLRRLVDLAESVWSLEGGSFESGISQAAVAVLSSPSFIFKETFAEESKDKFPLIDEYSLASRLSYFLWSTMPDEQLMTLAEQGKLRENLDEVIQRMIVHASFDAFYKNFIGQWLQTRDVMSVSIDARAVLRRDGEGEREREIRDRIEKIRSIKGDPTKEEHDQLRQAYRELRELYRFAKSFALSHRLRKSMRRETEMLFAHLVETDADLIELIDCDYTFLNEQLAKQYGIEGVQGHEMRRFELKPEHHRGSILTHGSLLTVTSNPDRTSPVKRGLFILDNILGLPTGAPPPDIPALEDAGGVDHDKLSLRQSLALHREDPMCSSCHNRMDPLGLALENFDALGRYRTHDSGDEVDASGTLITGESFENIQDLKKILSENHREKFYRCLAVKMMTYALGRSVEYHDTEAIDKIVEQMTASNATARTLIKAIVKSPGFQRTARRHPLIGKN